jgi:hypothetical protein
MDIYKDKHAESNLFNQRINIYLFISHNVNNPFRRMRTLLGIFNKYYRSKGKCSP